jgi:hypothetical protein
MADDPYQFRLSPEEEAALEEEWAEEQAAHYPTPLPTDGDKLFKKDRNKQREEMHRTFKPAMTYINGYERAADLLYAQLQDGAKQGDSTLPAEHWLVYPVYFMYRHALELSLKNILRTASPTLNEKQRERITETHNVYTLWSMAKSWVMQFASDELKAAMPAFESMLNEIQIHDPEGEAGRYEMRKVGKRPNRILVATFPSLSS